MGFSSLKTQLKINTVIPTTCNNFTNLTIVPDSYIFAGTPLYTAGQLDTLIFTFSGAGTAILFLLQTDASDSNAFQLVHAGAMPQVVANNASLTFSGTFLAAYWNEVTMPLSAEFSTFPSNWIQVNYVNGDKLYFSQNSSALYSVNLFLNPDLTSEVQGNIDVTPTNTQPTWISNVRPGSELEKMQEEENSSNNNLPIVYSPIIVKPKFVELFPEVEHLGMDEDDIYAREPFNLICLKRFYNTRQLCDLPNPPTGGEPVPRDFKDVKWDQVNLILREIESYLSKTSASVYGYAQRLAIMWNKLMHALNGNTSIMDAVNIDKVVEDLEAMQKINIDLASDIHVTVYDPVKVEVFSMDYETFRDSVRSTLSSTDYGRFIINQTKLWLQEGSSEDKVEYPQDDYVGEDNVTRHRMLSKQGIDSLAKFDGGNEDKESSGHKGATMNPNSKKDKNGDKKELSAKRLEHGLKRKRELAKWLRDWKDVASWIVANKGHLKPTFVEEVVSLSTFYSKLWCTTNVYETYCRGWMDRNAQEDVVTQMYDACEDLIEYREDEKWLKYWRDLTNVEWSGRRSSDNRESRRVVDLVDQKARVGTTEEEAKNHNSEVHSTNGNIAVSRLSVIAMWLHMQWNKLMHALNGNTMFPSNMRDVMSLPSIDKVSSGSGGSFPNVIGLASRISNIPSGYISTNANITNTSFINAPRIQINNTLTPTEQMLPTELIAQNRTYRGDDSVWVGNQTERLCVSSVQTQNNPGIPIVLSPIGNELYDKFSTNGITNQNRQTMNTNGFAVSDIFEAASDQTVNNFVGESLYMKWLMQLQLCSNAGQVTVSNIYNFNQVELTDPYSQTVNGTGVVLGINDSPIFGEGCGGDAAVFPFGNGQVGAIRFHVSIESVAVDRRANAIFVPNFLINSCSNPQVALALIVLGFSPWPYALHTYEVANNDIDLNDPRESIFIDNCDTTALPGNYAIDIILPKSFPGPPPGNQGDANTTAVIVPTTGNTVTNLYAANDNLNICFLGGDNPYNLCEYLYSYWADWSTSELVAMIITVMKAVGDDMGWIEAWRKVAFLTTTYKPMQSQIYNGIVPEVGNNAFIWNDQLSNGQQRFLTIVNWPQNYGLIPPTLYIGELRERAWSKLMCGAYEISGKRITPMAPNWLNHPCLRYYTSLVGRQMAATYQTFYREWSITCAIANTALTQTQMDSYREFIRMLFVEGTAEGKVMASEFCATLEGIYRAVSKWDILYPPGVIGVFGSQITAGLLRQWHSAVNDDATAYIDGVVISLLCDVHYQLIMEEGAISLCMSPFPQGFTKDGLQGIIPNGWREFIVGQSAAYGTWHPDNHLLPSIRQDDIFKVHDEEVWNDRVAYHMQNMLYVVTINDISGTRYALSPPNQQTLFLLGNSGSPLMTNPSYGFITNACTTWIPKVTTDGIALWCTWTPLAAATLNRNMTGAVIGYIETWQIGRSMIPPTVVRDVGTKSIRDKVLRIKNSGGSSTIVELSEN